MKVTIIGSGIFALAIAKSFKKEISLLIWTHEKKEMEKEEWKNFSFTTDFAQAINFSDHIFFLVSSPYVKSLFEQLKKFDVTQKTIYIGTKGLLNESPYYYSKYLKENVILKNIASFSGPNLAQDMILEHPTSITFAFLNPFNEKMETLFSSKIRISVTQNIQDTELASVLKNIYAIGSGILWENKESKSTILSYLSFAFFELKTMIPHPTVDILGDFFLTGTMVESRNFTYGRILKRKEDPENYLKTHTVEGVQMIPIIKKMDLKNCPILNLLVEIVLKEKDPIQLEETIFGLKDHE